MSKKNVETEKLFLTLNEACKMLRLSRPTLVKLIKQGKIKAFKPSIRVWRIPAEEVFKFEKNCYTFPYLYYVFFKETR